MYNPYMVGKNIYLRSPTIEDVEGVWHEWLSDEELTYYLGDRYLPNNIEKQRQFYESIINSRDRLVFSIIEIETEKHIGACNISAINWKSRHCDIALIIGDKNSHSRGFVSIEVVKLLLKIAFSRLNMLNVKGSYVASNQASAFICKKLGFEVVGYYKELLWCGDKYEDVAIVQLQREAWLNKGVGK